MSGLDRFGENDTEKKVTIIIVILYRLPTAYIQML